MEDGFLRLEIMILFSISLILTRRIIQRILASKNLFIGKGRTLERYYEGLSEIKVIMIAQG